MTLQQATNCVNQLPNELFLDGHIDFAGVTKNKTPSYSVYIEYSNFSNKAFKLLNSHIRSYSDKSVTTTPDLSKEALIECDYCLTPPTDKKIYQPIRACISANNSICSTNLFFTTKKDDHFIYSLTCAHPFKSLPHKHHHPVKYCEMSHRTPPEDGRIHQILNIKYPDLAVLKFPKYRFMMNRRFQPVEITHGNHNSKIALFGARTQSTNNSILLSPATLYHEGVITKNLYATKGICKKGDSGAAMFKYKSEKSYCYGLVIAERKQFTFFNNLSIYGPSLIKKYNIKYFFHLTQ